MQKKNTVPRASGRLQVLLRAFESRNYRLFFAGQSVSLVGTWMQQVAMLWLVYRLTDSAILLGVVGFASQIPAFFISPIAGVLADRWNRRRLLLCTQSLAMLQAAALAFFVLAGNIEVWQIIGLSLFLGIINAFDIPVRQSFIVELVAKKEDLGNAIALNSSMVTGARMIGPSIAGILVASIGEGICFVINAASYLAVIVAIAAMTIKPASPRGQKKHVLHELREGFEYAFGFPPIRYILALIALLSLMGMPYSVLMPIFAKEILHGGAHTFGFLMAAAGGGALASAIYLASRRSVRGLGRVMSFFTLSFLGLTPIGSLMAGAVASKIGVQSTLIIGGITCFAGGMLFAKKIPSIREIVRPIYVRMGIIPEVAIGIRIATEAAAPPIEQE